VQGYCERHAVARQTALRVTLILEELFTNSITHGHGGDSSAPISVELSAGDGVLWLQYEDKAPRFDPRARLDAVPVGLDAPLESRPAGGLGLYVVGQLVTGAHHVHEAGGNRLWLTVALEPGPKA
jgi:serine/threonine-protein kinase RsbW